MCLPTSAAGEYETLTGKASDIFEFEAVSPSLVKVNFASDLEDGLWIHFVDNAAALSCRVHDGRSVNNGDFFTGQHMEPCG